jgi:DNA (cytosine-5)-methyltransferase 1
MRARVEKPPYRVPSMAEIAAIPANGFRLVSTFSGCGGSCLGFKLAGFRTLWANEFIAAARETYAANYPEVPLDPRDIREIEPAEILNRINLASGEIDVLEGSPPCASFSSAGRRNEGWGKVRAYSETTQRTDDLFFEFIRLLAGLRPKVFVAENVAGLVRGVSKGYFKEILAAFRDLDYRVEARLLDAQWLGVPQARLRLIFLGVRNDLNRAPRFPKPFPYRYSVRDALAYIDRVEIAGPGFTPDFRSADQPAPSIMADGNASFKRSPFTLVETKLVGGNGAPFDSKAKEFSLDEPLPTLVSGQGARGSHQFKLEEEAADISGYAIGREYDTLAPGASSKRYFSLVRPDERAPSPAVTATGAILGAASVAHPTERRKFTIRELKRICAFPDDFVLTGSYSQQWERLGRAVPPLMMFAVATEVAAILAEGGVV